METSLHHIHLFASDLDESVKFYQDMFEAKILFDRGSAETRNVMIEIGASKIIIYNQAPKDKGSGAFWHLGFETNDLETLVEHMKSIGYQFSNEIKSLNNLKYVMASAPDNVLLELFEVVR
ncbi:MAG: VOC family protein [Promethearchaeota archaeon]